MIRKIAVRDKNGVIRVAEIGGGGTPPELERFEIDAESKRVRPGNRTLTWAEVEALTVNTGVTPTAEEKEMYRDDEGGYTRKRIVYEGYLSGNQASSKGVGQGLAIQAYAKEATSKVTMYDWKWRPIVDSTHPDWGKQPYWMNNFPDTVTNLSPTMVDNRYHRMRKGMDDMEVALTGDDRYTAQQRVYVDIESQDGVMAYYVLVLRNAQDSGREIYGSYGDPGSHFDYFTSPDHAKYPISGGGTVYKKGANIVGTRSGETIWIYPAGMDLTDYPPNVEVALTAAQAREKLAAGENLIGVCRDPEAVKETLETYPGDYPLVYKARLPYCQFFKVRVELWDPLSDVGITPDNTLVTDYNIGGNIVYCNPKRRTSMITRF